jgi:hypothetical protein
MCNTRGCTCFINGCFGYNWFVCCDLHGKRYANSRLTRLGADILLYRCVKRKSHFLVGAIMFVGVRLVGWVRYTRKDGVRDGC